MRARVVMSLQVRPWMMLCRVPVGCAASRRLSSCSVRCVLSPLRNRFGEACLGWRVVGEFPVGPILFGCEVVARMRFEATGSGHRPER